MTAARHVLEPTARPADEFTNRSGEIVRAEQVGWSPDRPASLRFSRFTRAGGVYRVDLSSRFALRLLGLVLAWAADVDPTGAREAVEAFMAVAGPKARPSPTSGQGGGR